MEKIGFVDILLVEKVLDLGCYTQGLIDGQKLLIEDPISRQAGLVARYSMGSLWPAIGPRVVPIDDPAEKRAFIESAVNELLGGEAPVGLRLYIPLPKFPR